MAADVPISCAKLTPRRVKNAIIREGSMRAAAIALNVPWPDLRQLAKTWPGLLEAATEAEERALDQAEAALRQALRSESALTRLQAASHIVRRSGRW
jgi:hypothetical protein